jgi:hypothetical protein
MEILYNREFLVTDFDGREVGGGVPTSGFDRKRITKNVKRR